jgi:hypothetical protein
MSALKISSAGKKGSQTSTESRDWTLFTAVLWRENITRYRISGRRIIWLTNMLQLCIIMIIIAIMIIVSKLMMQILT